MLRLGPAGSLRKEAAQSSTPGGEERVSECVTTEGILCKVNVFYLNKVSCYFSVFYKLVVC